MSYYTITKEQIQEIKNLKEEARGQTIKNALQSIMLMEGIEGVGRVQKRMEELECWTEDYNKIKLFDWYPLWYDVLLIAVAADVFNWDDEDLKKFGTYNQKVSFFEKILLKYFISLEVVFKVAPERWKKHYSVGDLESSEFSDKEKYALIRLKNFSPHPVFCPLLAGYFESATNFVVRLKSVSASEKKCTFKGDSYHEYLITWE